MRAVLMKIKVLMVKNKKNFLRQICNNLVTLRCFYEEIIQRILVVYELYYI